MGPSTTPSKSKGKQLIVSSNESDTELEGVYQHTHTPTGVVAPLDYSDLARGIEVSELRSAIAELQALNSSVEKEAFAYMASTTEEMDRRFEQQAQAQREQLDMIHAQQESIDTLKQMLSQLLEGGRRAKPKTPSKKSKGKRKEGESLSSAHTGGRNGPTLSRLNLHSKREAIQRMGALIPKG